MFPVPGSPGHGPEHVPQSRAVNTSHDLVAAQGADAVLLLAAVLGVGIKNIGPLVVLTVFDDPPQLVAGGALDTQHRLVGQNIQQPGHIVRAPYCPEFLVDHVEKDISFCV